MHKRLNLIFSIYFLLSLSYLSSQPDKIVRLNAFTFDDGHHQYYFDLLESALGEIGYKLELQLSPNVPQKRIEHMLDNSNEDYFHIFIQTEERDQRWVSVDIDLTDSLIGHRILFIPPGDQHLYNGVGTLEDFRNLHVVGAFGSGWFDVDIWDYNDLSYFEKDGDWRVVYKMLALGNRGIDYFSRGITEILGEADLVPELEIEENLVFVYKRDFHLYFTDSAGIKYRQIIEEALTKAIDSGLRDRLIREYWHDDFDRLNIDRRIIIDLESPEK